MVIGKIIDATRSAPEFIEDTGPTRAADGEIIDNIPDTDNSVITITVKYHEVDYQFKISRQSTFEETIRNFKEQANHQTGVKLYQGFSNQTIDITNTPALIAMNDGDLIVVEDYFNGIPGQEDQDFVYDPNTSLLYSNRKIRIG